MLCLLLWKMEEIWSWVKKWGQPLKAIKGKTSVFLSLRWTQPAGSLWLAQEDLVSDFWPPELKENKGVLFKPTKLAVVLSQQQMVNQGRGITWYTQWEFNHIFITQSPQGKKVMWWLGGQGGESTKKGSRRHYAIIKEESDRSTRI